MARPPVVNTRSKRPEEIAQKPLERKAVKFSPKTEKGDMDTADNCGGIEWIPLRVAQEVSLLRYVARKQAVEVNEL